LRYSALFNDAIDHQYLVGRTETAVIQRRAGLEVIDNVVALSNIPDKFDSVSTIA